MVFQRCWVKEHAWRPFINMLAKNVLLLSWHASTQHFAQSYGKRNNTLIYCKGITYGSWRRLRGNVPDTTQHLMVKTCTTNATQVLHNIVGKSFVFGNATHVRQIICFYLVVLLRELSGNIGCSSVGPSPCGQVGAELCDLHDLSHDV